jgi:2-C-methyl-D-erythritol 4-phosphate cytidylyltransferase
LTAAVEKQFLLLGGIPMLARTLEVFDKTPLVDGIILAVGDKQRQTLEDVVLGPHPCRKPLRMVAGGLERQESVSRALQILPNECELVIIHDAVRPLLTSDLLILVVEAAWRHGAALAAIPSRDTVKSVKQGRVAATLNREVIWLAQTPQAFRAGLIRQAHEQAVRDQVTATDDATLVERLGVPVYVVPGSEENIKVTTWSDLAVAEAILACRELNTAH